MKVFFVSTFNAVILTLLMGCGSSPVASDVSQREANRIVALLHKNGITADLHSARIGKGRYVVLVPESEFPNAATILSNRGLPSEKQPSFEEMTASNGIIPTWFAEQQPSPRAEQIAPSCASEKESRV